ncbi:hypothetical protein AN958_00310 [Leucoagaricus sp. SymC.cos]|nr:hypothetical protein AN958_00310 [Leucoagaricus sp. SymC.cos]
MWADQVSATEDPAISLAAGSIGKATQPEHTKSSEAVAEETIPAAEQLAPPHQDEAYVVATPEQLSTIDLPVVDTITQKDNTAEPVPEVVAFPSSASQDDTVDDKAIESKSTSEPAVGDTSTPLAFPSSELEPSEPQGTETRPTPAVTFGSDVNPSRTGTPDPDSEPKRKRISSQNFQRLARRISITARRQSSSMIPSIPGLKRDSPRVSVDEGSRDTDSATGSIKGDDKGKKKKDKKDKSRKSTS